MSIEKYAKNNECQNFNKLNPVNIQKAPQSGYALSSWNYGSFHYTNPRYTRTEQAIKVISAETANEKVQKLERPVTSQLNKFGKRILAENEKIVTEEFLKAMNDSKYIRGTSRKLNQNRSSSNLRGSSNTYKNKKEHKEYPNNIQMNITNSNYYENQNTSNLIRNNSNFTGNSNAINNNTNENLQQPSNNMSNNSRVNNLQERSKYSSAKKDKPKIYRYGMSFEEWNSNKNRQIQVTKNLNLLKEHELREYEKIEQKIEQNYNKIK